MSDNLDLKENNIELFSRDAKQVPDSAKEHHDKKKKSPKTYNIIRIIALIIAAGILIYASYNLTDSYLKHKEDVAKYAEINEIFVQDTEEKELAEQKGLDFSEKNNEWVWDYKAMLEYNDEAKGYIKLDNTRIQYPIVEHSDNDFYLNRGSDKISNGAGAIFLDYRTAGLDGNMCILYGHNMLDGSMFKDLMNFRKNSFCKKHQIFDVYVGYRHYRYYTFAVFSTKDDNEAIYKFGFNGDGEFQTWINQCYSRSTYKFDCRKPDTSDKIIMCSTCIDDKGSRQIVCMYRGEEVVM